MTLEVTSSARAVRFVKFARYARLTAGIFLLLFLAWRLYTVFWVEQLYTPAIWVRFGLSGLILGGMYALVAIGYTLVYGIMFMINFAHGEVMMLGAFGGYFVFEVLKNIPVAGSQTNFLNAYPALSVFLAFAAGFIVSGVSGYLLEKIAYHPLRNAPRLVLLITAIGASIFLQNAVMLLFGAQRRTYANPDILSRTNGWTVTIAGSELIIPYTGVFTLILSAVLMVALYLLVQRTRLGRAMRAVAQDRSTALMMGVNVDRVVSQTFIISGVLAGAAGVMWGIHMGLINHYTGFLPGIKAFTAAVLGGIGNIPGAMLGGVFLGMIEALGPAILGIDFQLKDVIAFTVLILVLLFRPQGILGEKLTEDKL
jgi:branched-chain amino acid transport system permease protein